MCQVLAVGYALAWSNKLLGEVMGSQPADIIQSVVSKSLGLLISHPETLARCLPELLGGFDSLEARARRHRRGRIEFLTSHGQRLLVAAAQAKVAGRGSHSFPSQLNLSLF
jgi:hypothetical protein